MSLKHWLSYLKRIKLKQYFLIKHNTHSTCISNSDIDLYDLNRWCRLLVLHLMVLQLPAALFHFSGYSRVSDYKYLWLLFSCYEDIVFLTSHIFPIHFSQTNALFINIVFLVTNFLYTSHLFSNPCISLSVFSQ